MSRNPVFSANTEKTLKQTEGRTDGIVTGTSAWLQKKIHLKPAKRGCHLITDEILQELPELNKFTVGICYIHIMHTSASLSLNENFDPDVRTDMEMYFNKTVPETLPYRHTCEGPDDMPAHIKSCLIGSGLQLPVSNGALKLGQWQGIWLCEHRNSTGSRQIIVTINGMLK